MKQFLPENVETNLDEREVDDLALLVVRWNPEEEFFWCDTVQVEIHVVSEPLTDSPPEGGYYSTVEKEVGD